ncbi:sugar nucleotide-binding protein [Stigmatella sp. ncwal1]|uniref:dTDP-4-dehydrorhamnose reductase n=1 Tax=Stigmatella ashevillensis TaxID=2995309 RepID=A0ABT5DGE1_9BACT|nr:sugar nucleotide-binding protein [Stigmatella ashevillena]MDC0712654.1 sugar nucleotide-binding protein [Stigmatella ashevillena]
MKAIVTGASGTIGSKLCAHLRHQGSHVVPWDRRQVPVNDYGAMERFVREVAPDVVFHLGAISQPSEWSDEGWGSNYEWASELAWLTRTLGVRFLFASTSMVFSSSARGPFTCSSRPDASEGYGYAKRLAEERVLSQNPEARVVRLGWQIGEQPTGNNMVAFLEERMRQEGRVAASTQWFPACVLLEDTVRLLPALAWAEPGVFMLDANERWSFYEIALALNARHGGRWRVEASEHPVLDQRMQDDRVAVPSLKERLPGLR